MANISLLSHLVNGIQRQVDLSVNTLVVQAIQINGILLSSSSSGSAGSTLVGDDNSYANFTPTAATVKGALSGIDTALAGVSGSAITALTGDVSASGPGSAAATVNSVGGESAAAVAAAASAVASATSADTPSTLVKRDSSGNFSAGTITASLTGHASLDLALAGGTMAGAINMGSNQINDLAAPSLSTDAATKGYVDSAINGLSWKGPVQAYSNANVALTGGASLTIDGYSVQNGDYVILANQTTASQNYVYVASGIGTAYTLTQVSGSEAPTAIGDAYLVEKGTQYGNSAFVVNAISPNVTFIQFAGPNSYTFQSPLSLTGNTVSLDYGNGLSTSGSALVVLAADSSIDVASGGISVQEDPAGAIVTGGSGIKLQLSSSNPGLAITSNALDVKYNASGAIVASASGIKANVDGSTLDINGSNQLEVKAAGITETQIASSALSSTGGLSGGSGTKLSVNVDGSTLDINGSNDLEVKSGGIGTTQLASASVTAAKLGSVTDGVTLDQSGAGSTLEVKSGGIGTTQLASASVTAAKLGSVTDGVTLDQSGAGSTLEIKSAGVSATQLATGAFDQVTITGGAGTAASVARSPVVAWSEVAGQTFSANTTYAVRYGLSDNSETVGRVYAADIVTSSYDLFNVIGFIQTGGSSVSAGGSVTVISEGSLTLKSNDTNFSTSDTGKAIYLQSGGTNASTTAPSTSGDAVAQLGIVQTTTSFRVRIIAPAVY